MFDPLPEGVPARVFSLPPGADFAADLLHGLRTHLHGQPPEAMARVELYVGTERMARRLRALFDQGPACLLPRIRLVTDLADPLDLAGLATPVPGLRRRLELVGMVARLIESAEGIAPRAAMFDLADSLASLMEEMHEEGVSPDMLDQLDVSDESGHWQRALTFFRAVQGIFEDEDAPDSAAHARLALEARLARWQIAPPEHPVIVAGSTGSRGTTARFMRAVAGLPHGALILPGFDHDLPGSVWTMLNDPLTGEDHPQFRFARLLREMELHPRAVRPWSDHPAPAPDRNRVLSLALRPAPVTHQWMSDGPDLPDLLPAMQDVTLVEATTPRDEAMAIALRLRQAAEDGTNAALITPDRMLTRQVTSALGRWGITPDDSAGIPSQLTAPGRFLRHVAALFGAPLSAEALLTLLKHPLTHSGTDRGPHLLHTRDLELYLRRKGLPFPGADDLRLFAEKSGCDDWIAWLISCFCDQQISGIAPLTDWVQRHETLSERLAHGPEGTGSGALWEQNTGRRIHATLCNLRDEAAHGPDISARDYTALFGSILQREEVRDPDVPHPNIRIWGTLEARVMGADLLILAGLNEGGWPEMPAADPWLNRRMRAKAGLRLPERRVGLSAHDFQQAAGAREVWLTRSVKSDDAETVPSRWVNRLLNLMEGLPDKQGREAIDEMRGKGRHWLALAKLAETPISAPAAKRPSPAPPVEARPRELRVTEVKTLVRDPYAIYASRVLRLKALDPLMRAPDALLRGTLVHEVLERFVKSTVDAPENLTLEALRQHSAAILDDPAQLPFPVMRALWIARMDGVSPWFINEEHSRQTRARPAQFEVSGKAHIADLDMTLTCRADRVDIDEHGRAWLYDYKTGAAPTKPQQLLFDKQLLLEIAMLQDGCFDNLAPMHVLGAEYISLQASAPKSVSAPIDEARPDQVWAGLIKLLAAYQTREQGYSARRVMLKETDTGWYDHLARLGEWDVTDLPEIEVLT
jgi:double-strand break repair protein AddB